MSNNKVRYYLYRIYALLKSGNIDVTFQRSSRYQGQTDQITTIYLSPNDRIFPTLIHECLHFIYPDWSETNVLVAERMIFAKLTEQQIRNLFQRMAYAIYISDH